jgi:predicted glycosyltransferase
MRATVRCASRSSRSFPSRPADGAAVAVRVVCHSQHLTGIGHHVRMHAIATALAGAHEVYLVEGGRPVPRPAQATEPRRLVLPTLLRTPEGELVGAEGERVADVLAARAGVLADAVAALRPDVVLVDHYPFSKWELTAEIDAAADAARAVNAGAKVVCSLRDIAPQTRHEQVAATDYADEVARRLTDRFDALLVHADPAWSRLADHFERAAPLTLPVRATGYVVAPTLAPRDGELPAEPFVIASAGGLRATEFLAAVIRAHAQVAARVAGMPRSLHVFAPAGAGDAELGRLVDEVTSDHVAVHPFSTRFEAWLDGATVSVSRAGYNTCAALLRSPAAAVLVPDPSLSDQTRRAQLFGAAGVAIPVESSGAAPPVEALAAAMATALDRHGVDPAGEPVPVAVDGAAVTGSLLERLVAGEDPWAPECRERAT